MAEKRMFSLSVVDSDAFLDMPLSSQALYFHLSMKADDDGFINSPKKIQRSIGATDGDAQMLVARRFIIPFRTGVIVIRHWRLNNYLRSDRYHPTVYQAERSMLSIDDNGAYYLDANKVGIPSDNQADTESSIAENSKEKISISFKEKDDNNTNLDISFIPSTDEKENINRFVELFNSISQTPCNAIGPQTTINITDILLTYDPIEITQAFRNLAASPTSIDLDWFANNFRKVFEGNI